MLRSCPAKRQQSGQTHGVRLCIHSVQKFRDVVDRSQSDDTSVSDVKIRIGVHCQHFEQRIDRDGIADSTESFRREESQSG